MWHGQDRGAAQLGCTRRHAQLHQAKPPAPCNFSLQHCWCSWQSAVLSSHLEVGICRRAEGLPALSRHLRSGRAARGNKLGLQGVGRGHPCNSLSTCQPRSSGAAGEAFLSVERVGIRGRADAVSSNVGASNGHA